MQTNEQMTRAATAYMDTVFRVAFNYLKRRDAADDITQEVFLRLFRADSAFENDDHLKHWLIRVTLNECKRYYASPWRRTEPLEYYAETLASPDTDTRDVLSCVMQLPRKYRLAIYLHYYEGYSTSELAVLLKRPKSTVCTWLERGRNQLKTMLLEDEHA